MKFLRSLIIITFLFKFSHAQLNHYEIIGDVKNIPAKMVYLRVNKTNPVDQKMYRAIIDSSTINSGKFILNRDTNIIDPRTSTSIDYWDTINKRYVSLYFQNPYSKQKHSNFILENAKIHIVGNLIDKNGIKVEGSKETDFYFKYIKSLYTFPDTNAIEKKIVQFTKSNNKAALELALTEKKDSIDIFKKRIKEIIINNPSNYLSLSFLEQKSVYFSAKELKELKSVIGENYINTDVASKLDAFIRHIDKLELGEEFPSFSYFDELGKAYSLEEVKGNRGTLVMFWGSWCEPFRTEISNLKNLYQLYREQGVNFVGISTDHDISKWRQALEAEKMPWTNLSNLPGDHKEIIKRYYLDNAPLMFLLDKDGKILMKYEANVSQVKDALLKL